MSSGFQPVSTLQVPNGEGTETFMGQQRFGGGHKKKGRENKLNLNLFKDSKSRKGQQYVGPIYEWFVKDEISKEISLFSEAPTLWIIL